jgi:hypothetical protein
MTHSSTLNIDSKQRHNLMKLADLARKCLSKTGSEVVMVTVRNNKHLDNVSVELLDRDNYNNSKCGPALVNFVFNNDTNDVVVESIEYMVANELHSYSGPAIIELCDDGEVDCSYYVRDEPKTFDQYMSCCSEQIVEADKRRVAKACELKNRKQMLEQELAAIESELNDL